MMTRNYSKNAVIKFNIQHLNIEKPADVIVSKDEETTIGIVIPPITSADEIAAIDFLNVKYQMRRAKATALRIFSWSVKQSLKHGRRIKIGKRSEMQRVVFHRHGDSPSSAMLVETQP